jgi:hypothetical protein
MFLSIEEDMMRVLNMVVIDSKNIKDLEGWMPYTAWLNMGGPEIEGATLNRGMVHFCGDRAEWFE